LNVWEFALLLPQSQLDLGNCFAKPFSDLSLLANGFVQVYIFLFP